MRGTSSDVAGAGTSGNIILTRRMPVSSAAVPARDLYWHRGTPSCGTNPWRDMKPCHSIAGVCAPQKYIASLDHLRTFSRTGNTLFAASVAAAGLILLPRLSGP
jgi:hypothetical protein